MNVKRLVKKIFEIVIILFGVTVLTFCFVNMSSISPAEAIARRSTSEPSAEYIRQIEEKYGYDKPVFVQYITWVGGILRGDFGTSYLSNKPVLSEITGKLSATLSITGMALVWIFLLTVLLSVISVLHKNKLVDHFIRIITILGISMPPFWIGFMMLILFAINIPIFEIVEYGTIRSMILPSLSMALPVACSTIRILRAAMLENMQKDYVVYAKSRGLSNIEIILFHVIKNAAPPVITLFFQNIGYMVAGSAIIESVFSWPGIGNYFVNAITQRDFPVVSSCILIMALIFLICNSFAEFLNKFLNPKSMIEMEKQ